MELDDEHIKTRLSVAAQYVEGEDVPQKEEIVQWTLKIARIGHRDAQYLIGTMYLKGRGVPQNIDEAHGWFDKASKQEHALARLNCKKIENAHSLLQGIAGGVEGVKVDVEEVKAGTINS